jgi:hypothetical protein
MAGHLDNAVSKAKKCRKAKHSECLGQIVLGVEEDDCGADTVKRLRDIAGVGTLSVVSHESEKRISQWLAYQSLFCDLARPASFIEERKNDVSADAVEELVNHATHRILYAEVRGLNANRRQIQLPGLRQLQSEAPDDGKGQKVIERNRDDKSGHESCESVHHASSDRCEGLAPVESDPNARKATSSQEIRAAATKSPRTIGTETPKLGTSDGADAVVDTPITPAAATVARSTLRHTCIQPS